MAVGGRGPWVTAAGAAAGATAAVLLARLAWRKQSYDCLVVGGGVMGSCTAYALAKKGYKVALLEQFAFLHRKRRPRTATGPCGEATDVTAARTRL